MDGPSPAAADNRPYPSFCSARCARAAVRFAQMLGDPLSALERAKAGEKSHGFGRASCVVSAF